MNDTVFSMTGRLTRRDYALMIAALCGGSSLAAFAALSVLLPLIYFMATLFFRETTMPFWILFVMGISLILSCAAILLPLTAIPATVRRLHDIGRGGWLAFPLVLMSLVALGLPMFSLFMLIGILEGMNRTSDMIFFDNPEQLGIALGSFVLGYFFLCFFTLLILSVYAAWIFFKKGSPAANRYGEAPVEEPLPSVYAAYFSTKGRIDRARFIFRTLIVIAAAGIILPILGQSVLYPIAAIGKSIGIAPIGMDFFVILIGGMIYPLAALPLVVRRLKSLGRSSYESLLVFAALLPNFLCTIQTARFLGSLDMIEEDEMGAAIIEEFMTIGTTGDTFFIALWVLCTVLSLIGLAHLLRNDDRDISDGALL